MKGISKEVKTTNDIWTKFKFIKLSRKYCDWTEKSILWTDYLKCNEHKLTLPAIVISDVPCSSTNLITTMLSVRNCCNSRMPLLYLYHWSNPSSHIMAWGSMQPLSEICTKAIFYWGGRIKGPVFKANITNFTCRLPWNLRASNSWIPKGLSRPVMWWFYVCF
jgi:hypothetical protein